MNPRLFYVVVAAASVCQGQNQTQTPRNHISDAPTLATLITETSWTPSNQNRTLMNQSEAQTPSTKGEATNPSEEHDNNDQKTTTPVEDNSVVSTISPSVPKETAPTVVSRTSVWGYILLVLLLLVIIILIVILYLLRRMSRTYSFDLRSGNSDGDHAGNFEALSLNDRGRETSCDLSMSAVTNGMVQEFEEHAPQVHVNHSETSGDSNPVDSKQKADTSEVSEEKCDKGNFNDCFEFEC
ncbi:uncharacterized protein LOC130928182 isoform X2 [Corythoichthys intestinalis]|uniref:uncharacterized protein LOC130928182 isoform X2 n=1 Tax=Corythoichthys intestinalis TaxID=161448 RepID=UPI0025A6620A|nr:uncharacterized protein LOC130928182 isoform X2 [Corythoichthys intestinalis]